MYKIYVETQQHIKVYDEMSRHLVGFSPYLLIWLVVPIMLQQEVSLILVD